MGTIDVASGDSLTIAPTTFTTTASSVITIEANSSVTINPTNAAWTNLGSVTLASGANLYLYGSTSAASLGSISNSGGTVDVGGTYDNSGQTLDGSASFGQLVLYGGAITGGTATAAGVAFTAQQGGTLSGVTFDGPLNLTLSTVQQSVHLANGATVVGSSGSRPGAINVTGYYATLYLDDTQTLGKETITLGNTSGYTDTLYGYDTTGAGAQVLTLGAMVIVDAVGSAAISSGYASGDGIVNRGVIDQTGGNLSIGGAAFNNTGTIDGEAASGTLVIDPTTFTNGGTIDVANGDEATIASTTFTTTAPSLITIEANSSVTVDAATTTLNGAVSGAGTLAVTGGNAAFNSGATASVANLPELGAGTILRVAENLSYAGAFSQGAGSILRIQNGDTFTLTGTTSLRGAVTGAGILALSGGTTTANGGASLTVSHLVHRFRNSNRIMRLGRAYRTKCGRWGLD